MTGGGPVAAGESGDPTVARPAGDRPRFAVPFSWASASGKLVELLEEHVTPGLVVDLRAGSAPHAERLVARGFGYVGLDPDESAVAALRDRGFVAVVADLDRPATVVDALDAVTSGLADTSVVAVVAADGLGSVGDPAETLGSVRSWMVEHGVEVVGLGVPNATQVDLAIGTLAGRADRPRWWTVDARPTRSFGERSMTSMLRSAGFVETARNDLEAPEPEVRPIEADPIASDGALLGAHLHDVRRRADDAGDVMTFVRLFRPEPEPVSSASAGPSGDGGVADAGRRAAGPGLTALLPDGLDGVEAVRLVRRLRAQAGADVVVARLATAECGDEAGSASEESTSPDVDDDPDITGPTTIDPGTVDPGTVDPGTVDPDTVDDGSIVTLSGVEQVATSHVVMLAGGEVVADDWARHLLLGAERYPGSVVRTGPMDPARLAETVEREITASGGHADHRGDEQVDVASLDVDWQAGFSFADHYLGEETPSAAAAFPTIFLRDLSRVWRDHGATRPHDLLVEASAICGVVDTDVGTVAVPSGWRGADDVAPRALAALASSPVLLPGSSIREVASLLRRLREANGEIGRLVGELDRSRAEATAAHDEAASLRATVDDLRHRLDEEGDPLARRAAEAARSTASRLRRRLDRSD